MFSGRDMLPISPSFGGASRQALSLPPVTHDTVNVGHATKLSNAHSSGTSIWGRVLLSNSFHEFMASM